MIVDLIITTDSGRELYRSKSAELPISTNAFVDYLRRLPDATLESFARWWLVEAERKGAA